MNNDDSPTVAPKGAINGLTVWRTKTLTTQITGQNLSVEVSAGSLIIKVDGNPIMALSPDQWVTAGISPLV